MVESLIASTSVTRITNEKIYHKSFPFPFPFPSLHFLRKPLTFPRCGASVSSTLLYIQFVTPERRFRDVTRTFEVGRAPPWLCRAPP